MCGCSDDATCIKKVCMCSCHDPASWLEGMMQMRETARKSNVPKIHDSTVFVLPPESYS